MKKLSATMKGLITGCLMIITSFGIYAAKGNFDNSLQYITYALYVGGILWTLIAFRLSSSEDKSFKKYFSQGFRCFIVVTFLMVSFTYIFVQMHPEMKEEMAMNYRSDLEKAGNDTPDEINKKVDTAKSYYTTMFTSSAIFGFLLIGSLVTLVSSAILMQSGNRRVDYN